MQKWLAFILRRLAHRLDPSPIVIELQEVDPPVVEHLNRELRGFPVYYWRTGENRNAFEVWPMPDGELRLMYKAA